MNNAKGGSCRTGWVWINVLLIGKTPPPIPDRLSDVLPEWVWGFFTFYELESSLRRSIRSGMREARKRNCEGKHCCCCSHPPKTFFAGGGGEPPLQKVRMPSQTPIHLRKGEKAQCEKMGGKGSSPTAHSQFCLLHPLLTSQTTAACAMCSRINISEVKNNTKLTVSTHLLSIHTKDSDTKAINIDNIWAALPGSYMVTVCTTAVSESALVAFASKLEQTQCLLMGVVLYSLKIWQEWPPMACRDTAKQLPSDQNQIYPSSKHTWEKTTKKILMWVLIYEKLQPGMVNWQYSHDVRMKEIQALTSK